MPAPAPKPAESISLRDVDRACHRWLLKNNPEYRANYEHYEIQRDRRDARAAGIADQELPHSRHFGR
jgi:hypothetical protein